MAALVSPALLLLAFAAATPPAPIVAAGPPTVRTVHPCLPASTTRGATVVMLGMYGGRGARLPVALGDGEHRAHAVSVTGRARGRLVLVLSAYEPTVWDLSAIRDRVAGVIASGYYPQAVAGLGGTVPVRLLAHAGSRPGPQAACGPIRYAYSLTTDIADMARDAEQATGLHPRRFYGGYDPTGFDVDGGVAAIPSVPRIADIRSDVRLVAQEPLARDSVDARLDRLADARGSGRPRFSPAGRIVEWDGEGAIIRDEGGGMIAPMRRTRPPASPEQRAASLPGEAIRLSTLLGLLLLGGLTAWFGRAWRKAAGDPARRSASSADPRWSVPPGPASPPPPPHFPDAQIAELSHLAALTGSEPLVLALHHYGRDLRTLAGCRFDSDLSEEAEAICGRHFGHAADRFRRARQFLHGEEAERADDTLRRALDRLGERLRGLQDEQRRRDLDGIEAAGRFIASRHPG